MGNDIRNKNHWFNEMWNPITGTPVIDPSKRIKNHCNRFSGDIRFNLSCTNFYNEHADGYYELVKPFKSYSSNNNFIICPFGTAPTLHIYRFDTPEKKYKSGRNLFVNAFADTFLMPSMWLNEIFKIAQKNKQHNFIFFSDFFADMNLYIYRHQTLVDTNMWFGFRITERNADLLNKIEINSEKGHYFIDIDEVTVKTVTMLEEYVHSKGSMARSMEWMLVSVSEETDKNLLTRISDIAEKLMIPIFFDTDAADLPHSLPKVLEKHTISKKKKSLTWAKCAKCGAEYPKSSMFRVGVTKGRNCSSNILGFMCDDCYEEFKEQFTS